MTLVRRRYDPRMRAYGNLIAICILLVLAGRPAIADPTGVQLAQSAGQPASRCQEVRRTEAEARGALGGGADFETVKVNVVKQALTLAVVASGAAGGPAPAGARPLSFETARQYILDADILSENVVKEAPGDVLVIRLAADVCIPPASATPIREIVSVGDFRDVAGRSLAGPRQQLLSFFATLNNNPRFSLIREHPASTPSDIVIDGRILQARKKGERVEVEILLEARFQRTNRVISSTATAKKRMKSRGDAYTYLPEAIDRAIEKAGPTIYVGIEDSPPTRR